MAVFKSFDDAKSALDALRHAGFADDETRAVPGSDVLDYFDELSQETGVWGWLMTELSRVIDTEAHFLDADIRAASAEPASWSSIASQSRTRRASANWSLPAAPLPCSGTQPEPSKA